MSCGKQTSLREALWEYIHTQGSQVSEVFSILVVAMSSFAAYLIYVLHCLLCGSSNWMFIFLVSLLLTTTTPDLPC